MPSPLFRDVSVTAYISHDHQFYVSEHSLAFAPVTVTVTVKRSASLLYLGHTLIFKAVMMRTACSEATAHPARYFVPRCDGF